MDPSISIKYGSSVIIVKINVYSAIIANPPPKEGFIYKTDRKVGRIFHIKLNHVRSIPS